MKTRTMAAGQFKATCLAVMDEVQKTGREIIVTKRGKPVAKMVSLEPAKDEIFGFLKGKIKFKGNIVKPAMTLREWGNLA
jgi:prevent-host-death family protein